MGISKETSVPDDRRIKVLVIDDNRELLNIIGIFLKNGGIDADLADSGESGLTLLGNHPDKYSLVLLDIHLRGITGHDVVYRIRQDEWYRMHPIPIIAMSGDAGQTDAILFDYVLRKPFQFEDLIPTIFRVLQNG